MFQTELADLVARHGFAARENWRFNPHVTLAYQPSEQRQGKVEPICWVPEEFVLIHSHVGATRHDVLGRWRFDGQPELF